MFLWNVSLLKVNSPSHLIFSDLQTSPDDFNELLKGVKPSLKHLGLVCSTTLPITHLSEFVKKASVTSLDLEGLNVLNAHNRSGSKFDAKSFALFCEYFKKNQSIKTLNLNRNSITNRLISSGSQLSNSLVQTLVDTVLSHKFIKDLYVSGNEFDDNSAIHFGELLKQHKNLKILDLSGTLLQFPTSFLQKIALRKTVQT